LALALKDVRLALARSTPTSTSSCELSPTGGNAVENGLGDDDVTVVTRLTGREDDRCTRLTDEKERPTRSADAPSA
jgi:hypothetical protein